MNEVYVVKKGDTLYGISNQYGVSVTELANLNNVTAETLQIGQTLIIPSKSGINPDNMFLYTVKKGDSLYSIAMKYNIDVNSIKNLNYLTSDSIYVGQVIRIPEIYTKPEDMYVPQFVNYTVKKGDSLYSIASSYGTTIDAIMRDNGLTSSKISIGQNIKIRTVSKSDEVLECFGEEYNNSSNPSLDETYIVKKGDSLYSIAKKYNVSVSDILKKNLLSSNLLSIGQEIKIPGISSFTYTVSKGDSLYSIAKKFNTSVDSIKSKNNLKNSTLSIGQVLVI